MKTADKSFSTHTLYLIALTALLGGVLYYYIFRTPVLAYAWFGISHEAIFSGGGVVLDALPSFVHVFAFSLLTWLVLDRQHPYWSTGFWAGINLVFEFGQAMPHQWAASFPQILKIYFMNGTFSIADIIAIFLAAAIALKIMKQTSIKQK